MQTPEEDDVIIVEIICEINYHNHEHICVYMLIYLDACMYDSSEAIYIYMCVYLPTITMFSQLIFCKSIT